MMNYTAEAPRMGNPTVCGPPKATYTPAELMTVFSGGVASDALVPDAGTGRVSVATLQAHVSALTAAGVIKARPTQTVGAEKEADMMKLTANDKALYENLQKEYCYYEQRYKFAFKKFLQLATSRVAADNRAAQSMLQNAKLLNVRLNGVLEVMNYLAASRVPVVESNKTDVNRRNAVINERLGRLRKGYDLLSKDNAIILAQREMVRYTEEKNNYNTNQIALWAAANVVALGVIFYVYRN